MQVFRVSGRRARYAFLTFRGGGLLRLNFGAQGACHPLLFEPRIAVLHSSMKAVSCVASVGAVLLVCCWVLLSGCGGGDRDEMAFRVDTTDTRAKDLLQIVQERDDLDRFARLIELAGVEERFRLEGPFTVFAPNNHAFGQNGRMIDSLIASARRDSIRKLVDYHMVRGVISVESVRDSLRVSTLLDVPVTLRRRGENQPLLVGDRQINWAIPARNGIVYVVGSMMAPPEPDTTAQSDSIV